MYGNFHCCWLHEGVARQEFYGVGLTSADLGPGCLGHERSHQPMHTVLVEVVEKQTLLHSLLAGRKRRISLLAGETDFCIKCHVDNVIQNVY